MNIRDKYTGGMIDKTSFLIEGLRFDSSIKAFNYAKTVFGTKTKRSTFINRLCSGRDTWEALCEPENKKMSEKRVATEARKRKEMADIIAELDARKAALK